MTQKNLPDQKTAKAPQKFRIQVKVAAEGFGDERELPQVGRLRRPQSEERFWSVGKLVVEYWAFDVVLSSGLQC